jgi:hypothetical protein|tara:strand:+ start:277 stop:456 length:180 start_codon:yes stop_codon:yes gene_type:complete
MLVEVEELVRVPMEDLVDRAEVEMEEDNQLVLQEQQVQITQVVAVVAVVALEEQVVQVS